LHAAVKNAAAVNAASCPPVSEENGGSFVWPQGLKRTKPREAVMGELEKASLPVTALYLFEKLQQGKDPIWLSTIYRVLESFVGKNAVVKSMPMLASMPSGSKIWHDNAAAV